MDNCHETTLHNKDVCKEYCDEFLWRAHMDVIKEPLIGTDGQSLKSIVRFSLPCIEIIYQCKCISLQASFLHANFLVQCTLIIPRVEPYMDCANRLTTLVAFCRIDVCGGLYTCGIGTHDGTISFTELYEYAFSISKSIFCNF